MNSASGSEQRCFKADRDALLLELELVGSALEYGVSEMTMIAAENVFERHVSKILDSEARAMHRMALGLKDLRTAVAHARIPKSGK